MKRRLDDWIDRFFRSTEGLPSPEIFRRWAGISIVSGALERRVWVRSLRREFYPNLYTLLVAPPGVGKSVLTSLAAAYFRELPGQHLSANSLTKASLVDNLKEAERHFVRPNSNPAVVTFNSLKVCADEFGVFLSKYDNEFLSFMNAIYDNYPYSEKRRGGDLHIEIRNPHITFFGGTQPGYLRDLLPEAAWDQGFTSRLLFIYDGESQLVDPLADEGEPLLDVDLTEDLKSIGEVFGKMTFEQEAAKLLVDWHMAKGPPIPDHPKLHHYLTRRTAHILKLSMISAVSAGRHPTIVKEDIERAFDWLFDAEARMPDVFRAMSSGGDIKIMEETWHYAFRIYSSTNKPIPEALIVDFIAEQAPAHNVTRILDVMIKANWLKVEVVNKVGNCYRPRAAKKII